MAEVLEIPVEVDSGHTEAGLKELFDYYSSRETSAVSVGVFHHKDTLQKCLSSGNESELSQLQQYCNCEIAGANPDRQFSRKLELCLSLAMIIADGNDIEGSAIRDRAGRLLHQFVQPTNSHGSLLLSWTAVAIETALDDHGSLDVDFDMLLKIIDSGGASGEVPHERLFGRFSATVSQSSETTVLLLLGIKDFLKEYLHVDFGTMQTIEVYWLLQLLKYHDKSAASVGQLYTFRDYCQNIGVWQTVLRLGYICNRADGFDTWHRITNLVPLLISRFPETSIRQLFATFEKYLNDSHAVTEKIVEFMTVEVGASDDLVSIHDAIIERLLDNIHSIIAALLDNFMRNPDALERTLQHFQSKCGTRIAIAREINQQLLEGEFDESLDYELILRLLDIEVQDVVAAEITESVKESLLAIFRSSRVPSGISEAEMDRDTNNLKTRLEQPNARLRIARDSTGRIISFVCLDPMWDGRPGYYASALSFVSDPDIVRMRGVLSVACYRSLLEQTDLYCAVYATNKPAIALYEKRFNAQIIPEQSSDEVVFMRLPCTNSVETSA